MSVQYRGLGYVAVPTAGTPVVLSATQIIAPGCLIQAAKTNTGVIYIGGSNLDANTRGTELSPGDAVEIVGPVINGFEEEIDLSQLKIDAAVNGDKVVVSYFIRN